MRRELILIFNGELFRQGNSLSFETSRGRKIFPIKEIESIYCFGQITFTSRVFDFLGFEQVPVYFFSYHGTLSGVYTPIHLETSSNPTCFKIIQVEAYLDNKLKISIAKEFLYSGIDNIIFLLNRYNIGSQNISKIKEYKEFISDCKDIQTIMLREGQMRHMYYSLFNEILKNKDFEFISRSYRPPRDPLNALISFGNSMLYSFILSEIFKTDADAKIGFLHVPQDNRYSLVYDISEIFKPLVVDKFIFDIINIKMIRVDEHFEFSPQNGCYLNNEGKKVFLKYFLDFLEQTSMHKLLHRKVSYKYLIRLEVYKLIRSLKEKTQYSGYRTERGF